MSGPLYRVRQFLQAVRARPLDERELWLVGSYLPAGGFELFRLMSTADQRHSLSVLSALLDQGHQAPPLLQAALLHDVAKARIGLAYRAAVILLNALFPRVLCQIATRDSRSWRYPFYLSVHHAELGADIAKRAGLDPDAVALIRRHSSSPSTVRGDRLHDWQVKLKSVDDQN